MGKHRQCGVRWLPQKGEEEKREAREKIRKGLMHG